MNGGCPFAILYNLNNVDDKAIVPAWLGKQPNIKWEVKPELHFPSDIGGELEGEYAAKYGAKPNQNKIPDGDTLLAATAHLQPQNAVTTETFERMYNKVSKGASQSNISSTSALLGPSFDL